ncbi:MAG: secretin N-terminal domain-containing protein [Magnetococcales bacterium]|nr:secretin N-terminal domain-containing protein [Magnetococcales bacterium]
MQGSNTHTLPRGGKSTRGQTLVLPARPLPLVSLLAGLLLGGCQALQSPPPSPELPAAVKEATELLHKPTPTPTVPAATASAPAPASTLRPEPSADPEPLFDVSVADAPIRSVLEGVVAGTPFSLVVDPKVEGSLSLNLKRVTVSETMEIICRTRNLDCQRIRRGFVVLPNQSTSRLYQIHYPDMNRTGASSLRVASGQSQSTTTSSSTSVAQSQTQQQNPIGTQLDTGFHSDFWQELTDVLCATLGITQTGTGSTSSSGSTASGTTAQGGGGTTNPSATNTSGANPAMATITATGTRLVCAGVNPGDSQERNVSVSRQTGLVSIRALPSELRRIDAILERMQAILERQVILEAKIVEVQLNSGFQSGINWATFLRAGADKGITIGQTGGGTLLGAPGAPSNLKGAISGSLPAGTPYSNFNGTPFQVPYSAFGGIMGMSVQLHDFQGFLELLETQGKVHVLSSPRISTLNGQKAVIKVGTDDYYPINVQKEYVTSGTNTTPVTNFTLAQFFSGVSLDVVPRIGEDGTITMHIHPAIARVSDKATPLGGETYNLASNSTRESDSVVRARSGEIVVIGGLMTEESQQNGAQIPLLGSLPGIGALFGQKRDQTIKTELVILIKPTVVALERPPTITTIGAGSPQPATPLREWN